MTEPTACWNCGQDVVPDALFCGACNSLQPPPRNYYALLGFEREFLILDLKDLEARFYALSRQLHPDRFGRKSERERQYSLDASSVLNDAYRTLRNPISRAEYVLKRQGVDIGEPGSKNVPPELLEEVFELNMALEELKTGDDSVRPQLRTELGKFLDMLGAADRQMERQAAAWDQTNAPAALAELRGILNRRKYIQNLVGEVERALAA